MYFSVLQNIYLKSVGAGGTLHFVALNPEIVSLASSDIKLALRCILKPHMGERSL